MLHIANICWTWVVFLLKISYAFAVLIAEKWGVRCRTCSQLTRVPGVAYNCVCSFKRRGMGPAKRHATMMTPSAFQQWCRTLALAPSTCDLLASLRTSQPVRRVTSRAHNVSGAHLSSKMGVTIQFESHKVELWAILVMDRDPDVLEFFDQPHTFKLRYLGKSGKKMQGHYYTPDFLVLRKTSVCFEEWKTEADLHRLAALYPFRYQHMEDGSWRRPPPGLLGLGYFTGLLWGDSLRTRTGPNRHLTARP